MRMQSSLYRLKSGAYHNHINLIPTTLLPSRSNFHRHPTTNGRIHRTTMGLRELNSTTNRTLLTATILKASFSHPRFSHSRLQSWPVSVWQQGILDWMKDGVRLCRILGFWMPLQTLLVTARDVKPYGTILVMYFVIV